MPLNNQEAKKIWNKMGAWWDEATTDGDLFHRALIYPGLDKLLSFAPNDRLLDLACGNGACQ